MPDAFINAAFGPYLLREMISGGGIAEVYRATHQEDQRSVAVKMMRPEMQQDKGHLTSFKDEFAFLQRLSHEALPVARRFGEIRGRASFAMDLIPGEPLHVVIKKETPFNRIATFLELVEVVAYVHSQHVVHADLKLENIIMRPSGDLALVDFGNARAMMARSFLARLFSPGKTRVFGTPTYLAPELMKGAQPSYATDVYSLGVCAFVLLSGEPPFHANSRTGRLKANLESEAPAIRSRCTELPQLAADAIDRCLSKVPEERPQTAESLLSLVKVLTPAKNVSTTKFHRAATRSH
jgi:eukaryotic-like serine/threonine-protein kinase